MGISDVRIFILTLPHFYTLYFIKQLLLQFSYVSISLPGHSGETCSNQQMSSVFALWVFNNQYSVHSLEVTSRQKWKAKSRGNLTVPMATLSKQVRSVKYKSHG